MKLTFQPPPPPREFNVFALLRRDDDTTSFLNDRVAARLQHRLNSMLAFEVVEFSWQEGLSRYSLRYQYDGKRKLKGCESVLYEGQKTIQATFKYHTEAEMREALPVDVVDALDALDARTVSVAI